MTTQEQPPQQEEPGEPTTPLPIIAEVTRIVTRVIDRITGDRVDYPLLVGAGCVEALKAFGIESRVMFGQVAWVEILEETQQPIWAGCWGENYHFWVATQYGEVVDLNTSVACRKRSHTSPELKAIYSPPMLWSKKVPAFYRYIPEGIAEMELMEPADQRKYDLVMSEIRSKCDPKKLTSEPGKTAQTDSDLDFPNEPLLCPNRKVLDDSKKSFQHFDRALGIHGVPQPPI